MNFLSSKILPAILLISATLSCTEETLKERLLVDSVGNPGELFIVMDSIQWKGKLGRSIKRIVGSNVSGISQSEPYFKVHYIEPTKFTSFLKNTKNILFVATLDSKTRGGLIVKNYISKKYIIENPKKYRVAKADVYAKDQAVLYLFSSSEEILLQKIENDNNFIRHYYNNVEKKRLLKSMYKSNEKKGISTMLLQNHGLYMRIPKGYRIEDNVPGYSWIRSPGTSDGTIDKNIFITYKPYHSKSALSKHEIIAWRNEITKEKIFEDPTVSTSYMETDTINMQVEYNTIKLGGNYAKEIKGIWKTHNLGIGGPYVSYVVLDTASNQLFYLDGFVVAPGKKKRETLRELKTIISTFRTKNQMLNLKQ